MTSHELMGGKLQVYQRGNSRFWQCSASVGGKQRRASTKEESLALAKQIAEDWYLELRGKDRAGLLKSEKLFRQIAEQFLKEYEAITEGHRSPRWVEGTAFAYGCTFFPSSASSESPRSPPARCRNIGFTG